MVYVRVHYKVFLCPVCVNVSCQSSWLSIRGSTYMYMCMLSEVCWFSALGVSSFQLALVQATPSRARTRARTHIHTIIRSNFSCANMYLLCSTCMKTLRPINTKQGKTTNPNNSFFSEKKKELLGWDSNPRHTAC